MRYGFGLIGCGLLIVGAPAMAKDSRPFERGFYAGIGAAYHNYELQAKDLNHKVWVVENPADSYVDDKSLGYLIFAGYRVMRFVAFDVAYEDFGELNYRLGNRLEFEQFVSPLCGSTFECRVPARLEPTRFTMRSEAVRFAARGTFPFLDRWSVGGRAGVGWHFRKASDGVAWEREVEGVLLLGGGVSYALTPQLRANLDYEYYQFGALLSSSSSSDDKPSGYDPSVHNSSEDQSGVKAGVLHDTPEVRSFLLSLEYRF